MKTCSVQIGNSDNKLTQQDWSKFIEDLHWILLTNCDVHFFGFSNPVARWQNCAAIFNAKEEDIKNLKGRLIILKNIYNQDSIAWTEGEIEFLK